MRKILLIEDRLASGANTEEILELSNYSVVPAATVTEVLSLASGDRPDLVICDLSVSDSDPGELIRSLQNTPALRWVPLLVFTGNGERTEVRKIMALGVDDYLVKPFQGIELLRAVDACLERHRRRSAGAAKPDREKVVDGIGPWQPGDRDPRTFKKKYLLYSEGQRTGFVWYLVDGKVKTYRTNSEGKELITRIHGAGECVGWAAAVEGGVYTDNARVLEDARMIVMPRQEFLHIFNSDSALSRQLMHSLAHHAGEQEAGLLNLAYSSLRKKVANGILSLSTSLRHEEEGRRYIAISRDNLAAFVGSAPESLTRMLGDFRKEGLIDISDGRIWLLDEERLRKMFN